MPGGSRTFGGIETGAIVLHFQVDGPRAVTQGDADGFRRGIFDRIVDRLAGDAEQMMLGQRWHCRQFFLCRKLQRDGGGRLQMIDQSPQ